MHCLTIDSINKNAFSSDTALTINKRPEIFKHFHRLPIQSLTTHFYLQIIPHASVEMHNGQIKKVEVQMKENERNLCVRCF